MNSEFVLDASVTLRWALNDGSIADREYADQVLDAFGSACAWIPALWYTETIHVLRCAEDAGKLGESAGGIRLSFVATAHQAGYSYAFRHTASGRGHVERI